MLKVVKTGRSFRYRVASSMMRISSHALDLGNDPTLPRVLHAKIQSAQQHIYKFFTDRSGISAVEFALVLPIMLVLYVGMAEFARAFDNWRKLEAASRTISDLTSQGDAQTPMRSSTMNDIIASANLVMRPFNGSLAKIRVSAMGVDLVKFSLTKPKVCSSTSSGNIAARSVGVASDLSIPAGFQSQGMRYILVELTAPYTPMLGSTLVGLIGGSSGAINLSATIPWPTRTDDEIVLPGGVKC